MTSPAPLRLGLILALTAAIVSVYWPSPAFYLTQWSDFRNITFTHGWLIVAVCVALLWRVRHAIAAAPARPNRLALLALTGCILAWLVCYRASIEELHITIFPAILWLAALAAWGWPLARLLAFPVAFFYFAVPSWAQLGPPLQTLTVAAMRVMLAVTGPPAVIDADVVHIPNGSFAIEEGCSGLHFMIVGLAVAALHGELREDSWRTRGRQFALMTLLALAANWVRVYVIIEAGYLTDMHSYLVAVSHYWFGWSVFAVALVIFFSLTRGPAPADQRRQPAEAQITAPEGVSSAAVTAGLALAVALIVGLPAISAALRHLNASPAPGVPVPQAQIPWQPVAADVRSRWLPEFPGARQQQRFAFASAGDVTVEGYAVLYGEQRDGAELVGSGTSLFGRWLRPRGSAAVHSAAGPFTEYQVVDRYGERSLIWSRYQVAGRDILSPLGEQLWYGIHALATTPSAALVALRAACQADCAAARSTLQDVAAHLTLR